VFSARIAALQGDLQIAILVTMSENPENAGAPEDEVTPAMLKAGERAIFAFGVVPDLSTAEWASSLADQVYRAMEGARHPKQG
jgi:hypothetical protein